MGSRALRNFFSPSDRHCALKSRRTWDEILVLGRLSVFCLAKNVQKIRVSLPHVPTAAARDNSQLRTPHAIRHTRGAVQARFLAITGRRNALISFYQFILCALFFAAAA
jgi:hypothetical protein